MAVKKANKKKKSKPKKRKYSLLPRKKTPPISDFRLMSVFVYGPNGIGKTSMFAQDPNALFLNAEPGTDFQDTYEISINSWAHLKKVIAQLEEWFADEEDPPPYTSGVMDTVDYFYKLCQKYVCKRLGIKHPSDLKWSKGWNALDDEFVTVITRLMALPIGIRFIGHHQVRDERKSKESVIMPSCGKAAYRYLFNVCNLCCFYGFDELNGEEVHALFPKPSEDVEAKDRGGICPEVIYCWNEEQAYQQLEDLLAKRITPETYKPPANPNAKKKSKGKTLPTKKKGKSSPPKKRKKKKA